MRLDGPRLALIGAASALRGQVHEALTQVWTGQIRAAEDVPADVSVVVLVSENAEDGLRHAARLDGPRVTRIPVLLITTEGARRLRAVALPAPVAWVVNGDEVDVRGLGLALRFVLEVGTRWRLADQLQALKPMADVGAITTVTSHEISNALTSLLLDLEFAQTLCERGTPSDQLPAVLHDAHDAARHLARVAADLARVSRPVGRLTTVDAVELAESARRLCADVLRGIPTRVVVARPARVRADERRATQVLVNLVRNAAQAMAGRDGASLELTIDRVADAGVIRVVDNGPGLPPAVAAHLFELWVTARPGGTGLGLGLARRYLTEMGGSIARVPTERGTTFEIRLPIGRESTLPTLVPDVSLSGVNILVVDDNDLIRRSLARALASIGEVVGAASVGEARAIVLARRFDVILLDMNLPDDSGRRLWGEWPPAVANRVVFLSGNYTPREQAWLEEKGLRWAVKPVGAEQVRQLVLEVLDPD